MSRHGFRIYTVVWVLIFLLVWVPIYAVILLEVTKPDRYRFLGGLLASIVLKFGFFFSVDFESLKDLVDHEFYDEWISSFQDSRDSKPQKYKSSRISLQFKFRYMVAIIFIAVGFIVLGTKVHRDRWALWIGLAIAIELVLRLGIESVCRNLQAGTAAKNWFKKKGWW